MGMTTYAVPLTAQQVEDLRAIAQDVHKDIGGLAARARALGYTRESWHIQPLKDGDGGALLLIHLDHEGLDSDDVYKRLIAYPPTDFIRWFGPRFRALLPENGPPGPGTYPELILEWRDAVGT